MYSNTNVSLTTFPGISDYKKIQGSRFENLWSRRAYPMLLTRKRRKARKDTFNIWKKPVNKNAT